MIIPSKIALLAITVAGATALLTPSLAQHVHKSRPGKTNPTEKTASPYKGQQNRAIKSLSRDDVRQLLSGSGWGFAKPAELSGYPGPRHILDAADELNLTPGQRSKIEEAFQAMNAAARATGAKFVTAERALSVAFELGNITKPKLDQLIRESGRLRAELRSIHLKAHLDIRPLLNQHQVMLYSQMRGYAGTSDGSNTGNHRGHH